MNIKHSNMRNMYLCGLFLIAVCSSFSLAGFAYAQEDSSLVADEGVSESDEAENAVIMPVKAERMAKKIPSLFFTYWQYKTIQDAKSSRGAVRPLTDRELDLDADEYQPDPGPREIKLDGILYNAENNWTIWINGERVSPDAIPKEVLDLRVYNNYVELKWLDEFTNRIFPLRLRVHQRFNLDMRIFLPG